MLVHTAFQLCFPLLWLDVESINYRRENAAATISRMHQRLMPDGSYWAQLKACALKADYASLIELFPKLLALVPMPVSE
jgi:hypothetical protein